MEGIAQDNAPGGTRIGSSPVIGVVVPAWAAIQFAITPFVEFRLLWSEYFFPIQVT
jgi:hypothetical protein